MKCSDRKTNVADLVEAKSTINFLLFYNLTEDRTVLCRLFLGILMVACVRLNLLAHREEHIAASLVAPLRGGTAVGEGRAGDGVWGGNRTLETRSTSYILFVS